MKVLGIVILFSLFIINGLVFAQSKAGPNIENKATKKMPPVYPLLARHKHVQSKVVIGMQINADGSVATAEFIEGNSMFKPVSLDAARQWQFQKTSDGMAGQITFNFEIKED
jgi:TonB family protein